MFVSQHVNTAFPVSLFHDVKLQKKFSCSFITSFFPLQIKIAQEALAMLDIAKTVP